MYARAGLFDNLKVPGFIINSMFIIGMFIVLAAIGFMAFGALNSVKSELPQYADAFRSSSLALSEPVRGLLHVDISEGYRDVTLQELGKLFSLKKEVQA